MKIVMPSGDWRSYAFIVHLTRPIDVLSQAIIDVAAVAAFLNLGLVVKFDFGNQQASKPAGVVVQAALVLTDLDRQVWLAYPITASAPQWRRVFRRKARPGGPGRPLRLCCPDRVPLPHCRCSLPRPPPSFPAQPQASRSFHALPAPP